MLTFGWAFSFLHRFVEAQGGLRASREEFGIFGTPGGSTAALRARSGGETDQLLPNGQIWSKNPLRDTPPSPNRAH